MTTDTHSSFSYSIQFSSLGDVAETLRSKINALSIILAGLGDSSWNEDALAGIQYFLYDLQDHAKLLEESLHQLQKKTQQN